MSQCNDDGKTNGKTNCNSTIKGGKTNSIDGFWEKMGEIYNLLEFDRTTRYLPTNINVTIIKV